MIGTKGDRSQESIYMQRALDLAVKGFATTHTNPMVGAVIVYNNRIIGEGYHKLYGSHHAEINAINSVNETDKLLLKDSTLYVTLEPCSHIGKTPPCAHRIVAEGIKKVVVGTIDPNPKVAGNGITYLREHGVQVDMSSMENACISLLDKFNANLNGLPYIQLKWAQSKDGFMGVKGQQMWLSNQYSRIKTHQYRANFDAILVGKNTVIIDNPMLDARYYSDKKPIRIVLDTHLEVPQTHRIYDKTAITWIVNERKQETHENLAFIQADTRDLKSLLNTIYDKGVSSLIVEGGAQILHDFIKAGYWHEAMVIKTPKNLNDGITAPIIQGVLQEKYQLSDDEIIIFKNYHKGI